MQTRNGDAAWYSYGITHDHACKNEAIALQNF